MLCVLIIHVHVRVLMLFVHVEVLLFCVLVDRVFGGVGVRGLKARG